MSGAGAGGEMEPGSCGFFAYVNPPRSPVVLEDTPLLRLLLLWSLSGPGHGQLMHNSAEFWMIILYGTVYFFWPFISSCALSLPPSFLSLSLFRLLLFCSFHYFYTVSSCLRSKWFRVDGDAKIIIKCSSRVQGPVKPSRGGTCHVLLLPCALSIEPKTSDIRPTTHDCPALPASHPRQPLSVLSADRNQSASLCGKWQRIIWFYFMCSKWPTENK